MRKLLSAALALSLGMGLAAPALAAGEADQRLTRVTLAVKSTLGVSDKYDSFYGEPSETPLGTQWSLEWTAPEETLRVTATETGKILSMNLWASSPAVSPVRDGLHFPAMTLAQAKALSDAFLDRVLTGGETAVYAEGWDAASGLSVRQYTFGGTIWLNGVPSPLTFRVRVGVDEGMVTYFNRDDQSDYVGQVPPPDTVTTADAARDILAGTLDLELIYVLDGEDKQAVLRYVPRGTHDYYVDAATGKLVDLTELREKLSASEGGGDQLAPSMKNEAAMDSAAGLSPAELEGIAKLEGVLTKEELGEKIKAWPQLMLRDFETSACSYSVERADPESPPSEEPAAVTARVTLVKKSDDGVSRRYVTVDARTGELFSMSGYDPYSEEEPLLTQTGAQAKADAFLKALWGDQWAKCQVYQSSEAQRVGDPYSFTYAQKVNGYFFPGNTLSVRVSAGTGAITGFSRSFDDQVTFDDAEGLISLDQAKTAWAGTFAVELHYLPVPVALDLLGNEVQPLVKAGYHYYNTLKPGYELGRQEDWCSGVDAKTGEVIRQARTRDENMTYDDVAGHWAQSALEDLALYNVGWWGGKADPDGALTQLQYIALLASADGYRYDPSREADADSLYSYAFRRGLLEEGERDEDKVLARADMVKMLLDSLGYKAVANLPGIFRCDYADAAAIPAGHMGYAALAQGLGLVVGDEKGNYSAGQSALRCEAAVLLWRYLSR